MQNIFFSKHQNKDGQVIHYITRTIENLNLLEIIAIDIALRFFNKRFFVNFIKEKCIVEPVGVHKIASVPAAVAKFLNL